MRTILINTAVFFIGEVSAKAEGKHFRKAEKYAYYMEGTNVL